MKITFTAKEIVATINDEQGNIVLDYKAENYSVVADMQGIFDSAFAVMKHIAEKSYEVDDELDHSV